MADRYFNPFQGIDLTVPVEYHDDMVRYSQREGKAILDQSPFPRMIDLWFAALCVAARLKFGPVDYSKSETRKFQEGSILSSDPWRVHTIMLIAIAHTDSVEVVAEPRKMLTIASGLAVAGLPRVFEMIKDGTGDPIWNLSDAVAAMIQ